jgi:Family of unknown function (DUF5996)
MDRWPSLALNDWEPTYLTLHRWTQIAGKIRLAHARWLNHWWHIPLYVSSRGLTTSSMPSTSGYLTVTLDFVEHRFVLDTSDRGSRGFALEPMSVADFYARVMELLKSLDVPTRIWPVPVEVADTTRFTDDRVHASYDRQAVERLHQALMSIDRVFNTHRGQFLGKSSPVHFFWGAFDLAVTRFSGRRNPTPPPDAMMGEAYSHEVISHGFWPGGDWPVGSRVDQAIFYAYSVPEPAGFRDARVRPDAATFSTTLGEFVLPYDAVRTASDPDAMLLDFMETTYLAAAERAGWDVAQLRHNGVRS